MTALTSAPTATETITDEAIPTTVSETTPKPKVAGVRRVVYNALGFLCVGLGIIGVLLPVWPTTVFAISASILFAKANPGAYRWLLNNRLLGPYLDNWHNKTGITLPYKIRTCAILWLGLGASMIWFVDALWLHLLLAAIGIAVTWHVFAIKTKKTPAR